MPPLSYGCESVESGVPSKRRTFAENADFHRKLMAEIRKTKSENRLPRRKHRKEIKIVALDEKRDGG
jgi:hypothetical protein